MQPVHLYSKLGSAKSKIKFLMVYFTAMIPCTSFAFQHQDPNKYEAALIPPGFVESKDVVYFELDKQGSVGTVEKVIGHFNKFIVGKKEGYNRPAQQKDDLVDKDGKPFDWQLKMDIIYPEKPSTPRPVFFIVATSIKRNIDRHTPFQQIFAKRGYVTVIIDHAYSPLTRLFGHNDAYYSLDDISGVKAYTAAVRFLRANAKKYSIDPNFIGGLGHSKGSYAITRLSDPDINAESEERFEKKEAYGPQLNTRYASNIQVGYQSMGNGTRSSSKYVTDNYAPTITAVGKADQYKHWAAWPNVVTAYSKDHDANWLGIAMLDRGHHMAAGFQPDLGYVREEVVEKFFSSYLEPNLAPNILYVTPFNGKENKNVIKRDDPIIIHFAPQMDVDAVQRSTRVIAVKTGKELKGTWKVMRKDTYFEFKPTGGLLENSDYMVEISVNAKSKNGIPLANKHVHSFSVSPGTTTP